jgi:DnaJ-domain-containing protein 1
MMWLIIVALIVYFVHAIYEAATNHTINENNTNEEQEKPLRLRFFDLYSLNNLFIVYAYLGLRMMRQDRSELRTQQTLLLHALRKRFSSWTSKDVTEYYLEIMKGWPSADYESLYKWMNAKSNEAEKIQLLDLLTTLAYHNDLVTSAEFRFLYEVAEKLALEQETIRSIIAQHQSRLDAKKDYAKTSRPTINENTRLKQKLHILGLSKADSQDDVKAAYRKQAKVFHPDRYAKSSKSEQKMAHERFIEIQAAYEYLMARF